MLFDIDRNPNETTSRKKSTENAEERKRHRENKSRLAPIAEAR